MKKRPVCLIVRDGWGYNEKKKGNAVHAAKTPRCDGFKKSYPWTLLDCCGEAVGLPEGYQGSSEVGHLNMGAGRIVIQELKRIDDGLSSGELFKAPKWSDLVKNWKRNKSRLHLMGLLQDEGVHAHQEHLFKIMRRAREEYPEGEIVIHPFLDGRDTPPRSTLQYLAQLRAVMKEVGGCVIGTIQGRYYAMDRSRNWDLTDTAYHAIVCAEGRRAEGAVEAVEESYEKDKTPDGFDMVDEYIPPYAIGDYDGVKNGDCVFHTNYRQDRAIQLTLAFVDPGYAGKLKAKPDVTFLGFTRYWDEFEDYLMGPVGGGAGMPNILNDVLAEKGLKQLRIAETQKFRHVTSFFDGKSTTPAKGELQIDVPSRFDPASFASHPEMEAYNVTDELLGMLEKDPKAYDFIAVNYANCDMVGHTGEFDAAKRATEVVDECVGRLVDKLLAWDFQVLITADHGNAEQMVDYNTGMVMTSHTLNPVEFIYAASDAPGKQLLSRGKLADIAATVLHLLGLPIPKEMDAEVLITTAATEKTSTPRKSAPASHRPAKGKAGATGKAAISSALESALQGQPGSRHYGPYRKAPPGVRRAIGLRRDIGKRAITPFDREKHATGGKPGGSSKAAGSGKPNKTGTKRRPKK